MLVFGDLFVLCLYRPPSYELVCAVLKARGCVGVGYVVRGFVVSPNARNGGSRVSYAEAATIARCQAEGFMTNCLINDRKQWREGARPTNGTRGKGGEVRLFHVERSKITGLGRP